MLPYLNMCKSSKNYHGSSRNWCLQRRFSLTLQLSVPVSSRSCCCGSTSWRFTSFSVHPNFDTHLLLTKIDDFYCHLSAFLFLLRKLVWHSVAIPAMNTWLIAGASWNCSRSISAKAEERCIRSVQKLWSPEFRTPLRAAWGFVWWATNLDDIMTSWFKMQDMKVACWKLRLQQILRQNMCRSLPPGRNVQTNALHRSCRLHRLLSSIFFFSILLTRALV